MKPTYASLTPDSGDHVKETSLSCKSCHRMIEIEGELLCYRGGKITELKPANEGDNCKQLLCDGWQKEPNQSK